MLRGCLRKGQLPVPFRKAFVARMGSSRTRELSPGRYGLRQPLPPEKGESPFPGGGSALKQCKPVRLLQNAKDAASLASTAASPQCQGSALANLATDQNLVPTIPYDETPVPNAPTAVKKAEFALRATAGYCFSPFFRLLSASRDFAALHRGTRLLHFLCKTIALMIVGLTPLLADGFIRSFPGGRNPNIVRSLKLRV
jgi:hypothetical protein